MRWKVSGGDAGRELLACGRADFGLLPLGSMQYKYKNSKRSDKMQTYLEQAFGKSDCSSVKMRGAVREWMDLYYGASRSGEDGVRGWRC